VAETGAAAVADIEPEAEAPADEVEAPAATVADESDEEAPEKA
jgi:hypothetical protein